MVRSRDDVRHLTLLEEKRKNAGRPARHKGCVAHCQSLSRCRRRGKFQVSSPRDFGNGEYEIVTLPLKITVLTTFSGKLLTFNRCTSHPYFENHDNEIRK